jgi:hypothetical protein
MVMSKSNCYKVYCHKKKVQNVLREKAPSSSYEGYYGFEDTSEIITDSQRNNWSVVSL